MSHDWIRTFFASADSLDVERFCANLPQDIVWRFGNFPTAHGIMKVRAQYEMVVQILKSMRHEIVGIWDAGDCIAVETKVFYGDIHGREFDCPGCDLFLIENGSLREVRIFVDNHFLFTDPVEHDAHSAAEGVA